MRSASFAILAALVLVPLPALATHPDHEGERGLEAQLQAGLGVFANHDESMFLAASDLGNETPLNAFSSSGLAVRATAGYRVVPALSFGASFSWQALSPAGVYAATEARLGANDAFGTWSLGLYARFYPAPLANGARENPRVFFQGLLDRRRFDPWISLGFDLVSRVRRARSYTDPQASASWTTSYVGVAVGLGADYRVLTRLAVGLALGFTPLAAGSTQRDRQSHTIEPGRDFVTVEPTVSYPPASGGNLQFFLGLAVRYTYTF